MTIDETVGAAFPSADANAEGRFRLVGEERGLGTPHDWEPAEATQLWRYHLHYFEWAWAFAVHPDRAWGREAFGRLWASWSSSTRFGRWDAWSPYVVSLRAWVLCGVYERLLHGGPHADDARRSIGLHAGFVRRNLELDVGGNHLMKNLKALAGLGVFLGDDELVAVARRHLAREVAVQILADGGHFERSPSYHCQVLADLVDVVTLLRLAGAAEVPGAEVAITRMRQWLGDILMPDGDVPLFNDCELVGADRLRALSPAPARDGRLVVLQPSGYVVVRPSPRVHLVADVGPPCPPQLPAHAHADCLSFELAVDGARVVVDTGTSTYVGGARRQHERSTAAHNTVAVDGEDQTEVWGQFRAARRADPTLEVADEDERGVTVVASHDGYERLAGRPRHRRRWRVEPDGIDIADDVIGSGHHRIAGRLHLLGDVHVSDDGVVVAAAALTSSVPVRTERGTAGVGHGQLRPVTVATMEAEGPLPLHLDARIKITDVHQTRTGEAG